MVQATITLQSTLTEFLVLLVFIRLKLEWTALLHVLLLLAGTTLIKRMHEQKVKEDGLGYIDPKQNRVITTHGFRSTFRDWSADKTDYPREVCEHVLAHKLPDEVEAAYLRGAYLEKRKNLMADWAGFCINY